MKDYQRQFIELALSAGALKFGEFTLKSGRVSPYFFNAGEFQTGAQMSTLSHCYAQALKDSNIDFDMLFGPAYKGIPLAVTTAMSYSNQFNKNIPYAYNRKEAKNHGEGGTLVGAPLKGKVVIIDDVITAGTAIREVLALFKAEKIQTTAIIIGLDRQEMGTSKKSAIGELEDDCAIKVLSIIKLQDILTFLAKQGDDSTLKKINAYQQQYGVSS